jgi:hypothetical protein
MAKWGSLSALRGFDKRQQVCYGENCDSCFVGGCVTEDRLIEAWTFRLEVMLWSELAEGIFC